MTTLVDEAVRHRWEKEYAKGSEKNYPNIELVRLEKWFFNNKPGKLIEYGFGSGVNTLHLAKCGYEINGVDATYGAIKSATKKLKTIKHLKPKVSLLRLKENAEKLPFEDETFDYAIIISVISLLGNYDRINLVLKEISRIMKPNAKIISDVNSNNSQFAIDGKNIGNHIFVNSGKEKNQEEIKCFCPDKPDIFRDIFSQYFTSVDEGISKSLIMNSCTEEFIYCGIKSR